MHVRCGALCEAHKFAAAFPSHAESAANALATLVLSCYPSASVVFTHDLREGLQPPDGSGNLEVVQRRLQAKSAARGEVANFSGNAGRLLARKSLRTATPSKQYCKRWWDVVSQLRTPNNAYSSLLKHDLNSPLLCPDAVVYLDGVEAADVANVVAPQLMDRIPNIAAFDNVGSDARTHCGDRREPTYCRRKVKWEAYWREKLCAMRGVDLLELSLPISAPSVERNGSPSRVSLLVSVANPDVSLASLHRQKNSSRRGPLRTTFGYSLPCLQNALADPVVQSVRLLRAWQQRVQGGAGVAAVPCTSVFWVSAMGHLLDAPLETTVEHPIHRVVKDWLGASREETKWTTVQAALLHSLSESPASMQELCLLPRQETTDFLSRLLFSAMAQQVSAAPASEWNSTNYFLSAECFEGTTDMASAAALPCCCGGISASLSRSLLEELPRQIGR